MALHPVAPQREKGSACCRRYAARRPQPSEPRRTAVWMLTDESSGQSAAETFEPGTAALSLRMRRQGSR